MSTFTKTLIATALAVAVAGPATAEVKENGTFDGTKMRVQVKPNGCSNDKLDIPQASLELDDDSDYPESGYWEICGSVNIGDMECIEGMYIERKVGKDLTMSMDASDLGDCFTDPDPVVNPLGLQACDGIVEVVRDYIEDECEGSMTDSQSEDFTITKGNTKLSKKGDRAKVDMIIEGEYTDAKDREKKVIVTIKSPKMDFSPFAD